LPFSEVAGNSVKFGQDFPTNRSRFAGGGDQDGKAGFDPTYNQINIIQSISKNEIWFKVKEEVKRQPEEYMKYFED
jgi:hypothetical protein